ncbi:MAG TPA: CBS domain-containing protein [Steroidobacteraceae bacterium]
MKVGEMCSRGVVFVFESASLRDVAVLMKERHVGAVVVIAKSSTAPQPVGIITDRDIVRAQLAHVAELSRLRVADVMTKPLLTLRSDEELEDAIATLRARGVRRAPVVNDRGELVGFLSTDDLIAEVARQVSTLAKLLQRQPAQEWRQKTG